MNILKFKVAMFFSWVFYILSILIMLLFVIVDIGFETNLTRAYKKWATKISNKIHTYCGLLLCNEGKKLLLECSDSFEDTIIERKKMILENKVNNLK